MVSDAGTTIAIGGLGVPLAQAAIAGLIDVSTIAISGDSIVGECATVDAGHSLVAAAIAGLSLPLADALGRPISVGVATRVGSNSAAALRSRMEFHPQRNDRLTLTISSNELGSRLPLKLSFGPGGLRTCNTFFQKTAGLL